MSKNITQEPESIPLKKWGKNHTQTSPNKHGCEKNNFNAHEYEVFNKLIKLHMNKMTTIRQTHCVHCGKKKNTTKKTNPNTPAIATITHRPDEGWFEIEVNHLGNNLVGQVKILSKLDW